MKICLISHEYEPFPGGGIATYHDAVARALADAGHEVHVVTNSALHGRQEARLRHRYARAGSLHVHRLDCFDEHRAPPPDAQFFDVAVAHYGDRQQLWAADPSNLAAFQAAQFVHGLHRTVRLDVVEAPEYFAEAFYLLRRRYAGRRRDFPPVCLHGHISSQRAFRANRHAFDLGLLHHRGTMQREHYCLTHADALVTPSRALMRRYEDQFGERLPALRAVIPYTIDLPDGTAGSAAPAALQGGAPYLLCIGRLEPRKGTDTALRAFARLASTMPDLRLAFAGRELWHQGESTDALVQSLVPATHRDRVLRLGPVPRDQVLAAARGALAVLHVVPWDNYPCAVLEAMAMGAACVVSDQGGQAEMVEHERSGLVVPADDDAATATAVQRLVDDPELRARLRAAAPPRARGLTAVDAVLPQKLELFAAVVERERQHDAEDDAPDPLALPPAQLPATACPPLRGRGAVVLDAAGADPAWGAAACANLDDELGGSEGWRRIVLMASDDASEPPAGWQRAAPSSSPWAELGGDDTLVWVRAGVRFDRGRLRELVELAHDATEPCVAFPWLRPAHARVFPYGPDCTWRELLRTGHPLPQAFAVRAGLAAHCPDLAGLVAPAERIAAVLAATAARHDLPIRHTGEPGGDYYADQPVVELDTQRRATGYLDLLGLMSEELSLGATRILRATLPDPGTAPSELEDGRIAVPAEDYTELLSIRRDHLRLKYSAPMRWLRKLRVLSGARRVMDRD